MGKTIFWDVDTQYDFMMPDGKLFVPDADKIYTNLKKITDLGRMHPYQIVASVDDHEETDPEISVKPDFKKTFPPHCIRGTKGCEKIEVTQPRNPIYIGHELLPKEKLKKKIQSHRGEILIKKKRFDVFTNPNTNALLDILSPDNIVVYGVCTDVCDKFAIEGFLKRGKTKIYFVQDAAKPLSKGAEEKLLKEWEQRGVRIIKTEDILEGKILK